MTERLSCDVLVVGSGPAGSAIAAHAARLGASVILAEGSRHPRPKACAEYASPAISEELDRLGVIAGDWRAAAVPISTMRVITRRGQSFELRYADATGARTAWGLDRMAFDALLARHSSAAGAQVLEETRLVDIERDGERVTGARLRTRGGEIAVRAKLVVGADGARSTTAHRLGVERRVAWPRRLGLVAHYTGTEVLRDRAEMHVGDGFYVGLAPTPGGELNVGMALPMADTGGGSAAHRFDAAIASLPGVADRLRAARRLTRISGMAPIGHRVRDVAGPGWLLVGDAAGFIDPFTGEGIFRALRGARAAADAVELLLDGGDSTAVAKRYRAQRRAAFAAKDALTWLVQGFLAAPPLFGYAAQRLAVRRGAALRLGSALGDLRPASDALSPIFLAGALRP